MKGMIRDLKAILTINPAAYTASVTGAGVDLQFFEAASVVIHPGTRTDGTHTPKLQESDDNSTFTDVAAADQLGVLAAIASNTIQQVGYIGYKRYIRVYVTVSGATTGAIYGAAIVLGHPRHAPVF